MLPDGLYHLPDWLVFTNPALWAVTVLLFIIGIPAALDRWVK